MLSLFPNRSVLFSVLLISNEAETGAVVLQKQSVTGYMGPTGETVYEGGSSTTVASLRVPGKERQLSFLNNARTLGLSFTVTAVVRDKDPVWPHVGSVLETHMRDKQIMFITPTPQGRPAYSESELVSPLLCVYDSSRSRGPPLVKESRYTMANLTFDKLMAGTSYSQYTLPGEPERRILFLCMSFLVCTVASPHILTWTNRSHIL